MGERTTILGTRYQVSKILTQARITGDVKSIANAHEINRQSVVKEVLLHLFLMSKYQMVDFPLSVRAATSQYLSGKSGNEAAHCVPGQIFYNGIAVQKLSTNNEYLEVALDCLFGTTDDLPANFNKSDTLSENFNGLTAGDQFGLIRAFELAANSVVRSGKYAKFQRAYNFYHFLEQAFQIYKREGISSFDLAIQKLNQTAASASGNDLQLRNERLLIIRTYKETLERASNSIETVIGLFPEDVWFNIRQ